MPTVSVVVPNYNHAPFLQQRVDSILAQTFQDFELILLDDCSTDDSRPVLCKYTSGPRVRLEFNDANSGSPFKQWNKGVRLARGKYVWIAESDDYADPRLLEVLMGVLEGDEGCSFAYCRSWHVTEGGRIDGFVHFHPDRLNPRWDTDFYVDGREECRSYFTRYNPVLNASAVLFRKAIYERVGGADETFRLSGDWKLWAAMALTGRVAYIGEALNYQRFHGANVQRNTSNGVMARENIDVLRWLLARVTPSDDILNEALEWQAGLWVPALMSTHVPMKMKQEILRSARAVDPHYLRRMLRPALATAQRKIDRHWRELRSVRRAART